MNTLAKVSIPCRLAIIMLAALLTLGFQARVTAAESSLDEAQALAAEGLRLSRLGDAEAAIASYRSALDLAPDLNGARFQLGRLLAGLLRFEEARVEFATVVEANPEDGAAWRGEATALLFLERWQDARTRLEEGFRAIPKDGQLAHLLARVLASAPDDEIRNGEGALNFAMAVYSVQPIPVVGETVAMAWAEIGDFDKAAEIQEQLIKDVEEFPEEYEALVDLGLMRERLEAYSSGEVWRARSPLEIVQSTELPVRKSN